MVNFEDSIEIKIQKQNRKYYINKGYDVSDVKYNETKIISVRIKDLPYTSINLIPVQCDYCGIVEPRKYYDMFKGRKTIEKDCCNRSECKGEKIKEVSNVLYGKNSHNYNQLKTDEERIIRRQYDDYKKWRNNVMERDNYICDICGNKNSIMNAHHLDGYDWSKEKRLNINNGITLCEDCHNCFHDVYGRGGNTKEQYYEFKRAYGINDDEIYILKNKYINKPKNNKVRPIYCFETGEFFESITQSANYYKINEHNIQQIINKVNGTLKNLHFIDKELYEDEQWFKQYTENLSNYKKSSITSNKKIICNETGIIYSAITSACKELHLHIGMMSDVLKGRRETVKGLHFKYYNEDEVVSIA